MIRSPETTTIFVREMIVIREMAERRIAATQGLHDDYDRRFALMEEQLRALERDRRQEAVQRLIRLGGPHCPSGSLAYAQCQDWLVSMGITSPGGIFEHDRQLIAGLVA